MKFFKSNNVVTVPGWKMTAICVSKGSILSEAGVSKAGVCFLADTGKCFYEAVNMADTLAAAWKQEAQQSHLSFEEQQLEEQQSGEPQQQEVKLAVESVEPPVEEAEATKVVGEAVTEAVGEAVCFLSHNDSTLQGKRILNVLGLLGYLKLYLNMGQTHAEGAEQPDGFLVYKGAVVKKSASEAFYSNYSDAYAKVDWDEEKKNIGTLREDLMFGSPSEAAKFVSGYKNMSGPLFWKDEQDRCLKELREHSICFVCRENYCKDCERVMAC